MTPEQRAEWLERRRKHITATEAGMILGLSPHGGPWDVWREKQGHPREIEGDHIDRGQEVEPLIAAAHRAASGVGLRPTIDTLTVHHSERWAAASVDYIDEDGFPVEIKSTEKRLDGPAPAHWIAQVRHQSYVLGAPHGTIVAVHAWQRCWDAIRDGLLSLGQALACGAATRYVWQIELGDYAHLEAPTLRAWWERHVRDGHPPEQVDGSDGCRAHLATMAGQRAAKDGELDDGLAALAEEYAALTAQMKAGDEAKRRRADVMARIVEAMTARGARAAETRDGRLRVSVSDTSGRRAFDSKLFRAENPDQWENYQRTGAPSVSVRVTVRD